VNWNRCVDAGGYLDLALHSLQNMNRMRCVGAGSGLVVRRQPRVTDVANDSEQRQADPSDPARRWTLSCRCWSSAIRTMARCGSAARTHKTYGPLFSVFAQLDLEGDHLINAGANAIAGVSGDGNKQLFGRYRRLDEAKATLIIPFDQCSVSSPQRDPPVRWQTWPAGTSMQPWLFRGANHAAAAR
jgi:hypothetical protein